MPRTLRATQAGLICHVLNRGNGRIRLFHKDEDYAAFLQVLAEGLERYPVAILSWCLMPNHWHLVLCPGTDTALGRFMGWVGVTHVRRHHEHYHTRGGGHLYQGRFKSFPVQEDGHLLSLCRYVEANALRAKLVARAEDWPFSSLHQRVNKTRPLPLAAWPVPRPRDWMAIVNEAQDEEQLKTLRTSVNRGRPWGETKWTERTARRLGLLSSLRNPGRPPKERASEGNQ